MKSTLLQTQMTAAVLHGRENLKIEQIAIPSIGDDEVLVRVKVALTCGTDLKVWRRGYHARMIVPPAVFGHELSGVIAAVGSAAGGEGARVGMRVVPANSAPCNACDFCRRGQQNLCDDLLFNNGAYAEYIRIPGRIVRENMLELPDHVSFLDAALVEPVACVLRGVAETGLQAGQTAVVIGCGPIGLAFIRILADRGVQVMALGKRASQLQAAERLGAAAAFDVSDLDDPVQAVRRLTPGGYGVDAAIEAVGLPATWQWAVQMARRGGIVNLFGGCPRGVPVQFDPTALHYSEITIKSTFHHTPAFIREALHEIARGRIAARDFITGEISLEALPDTFEHLRHRNGELKTAVIFP